MRSGACTLQQALTSEAASVLKHSLGLARRRGHAQVTPLHVAATLLSLRASSLRRACLKSQPQQTSHPLQCRALELCFSVALNRLPTTTPPGPNFLHTQQPSLSNALIAALKRAQAHQRRGCIEQQQQRSLLTIKVELEQLIVSILDDPSVSRVMREAGFSSTAVKNNIEESSSSLVPSVFQCYNSFGGVFSSPSENYQSTLFRQSLFSSSKDDVKIVLDILLRKKNKKNIVIVGDSVALTEGLVGEIIGKLERGDVPDELKSTHFIKFSFFASISFMKRDEVEIELSALRRKVDSVVLSGGRGIFYVGDLKWLVEASEKLEGSGYSSVDHVVSEMGKLFCEEGNFKSSSNVWLMGTASYKTYMRCQMRKPSLETQWTLQAVPVPSGGLGLSLHASSVHDSKMLETKVFCMKEEQDKLNCCEECATNYEKEAQLFEPGQKKLLSSWLQSYNNTEAHQKDELTQLKRKWNRLCHCLHQNKQTQKHWNNNFYNNHTSNGKIHPYNSSWWPNQASSFFPDSTSLSFAHSSNLIPRFQHQQSCTTIEFNFSDVTQKKQTEQETIITTSDSVKDIQGKEVKITLALGNSTLVENVTDDRTLRRAHICKLLQENVPWKSETIPSIAEALVFGSKQSKQSATWLFMQGNDTVGKTRLARAVAESVFGSVDLFLHIDMLKRDNNSTTPFCEMLIGALKKHEQLVVFVENFDFADTQFMKLLADGFDTEKFGTLRSFEEENNNSGHNVIFILSNGSNRNNEEVMKLVLQVSETKGLKRRAEVDLFNKIKNQRIEEKEEVKKRDFSRNSSFNTLDLNMKAEEEDEEEEEKTGESSPISSDLTRENSNGFFDSIEMNRFEFNHQSGANFYKEIMEEVFSSKIKGSFEEVCGGKQNMVKFNVEERVIEEIGVRCGSFTNSMFEKWLKDIFQRNLQTVNFGGKEGIVFTLCWGGKEDKKLDTKGFMGSCLPNNIQVDYFMD